MSDFRRFFFSKSALTLILEICGLSNVDLVRSLFETALIAWVRHASVLRLLILVSTQFASTGFLTIFEASILFISIDWRVWVIHLLKLLFQSISYVIMIWIYHLYIFNFALSLTIKSDCRTFIQIRRSLRDLMTLVHCSTVIKYRIVYSSRCLTNRECKTATHSNFEYLLFFDGFKTSWMVTHFAIPYSNFTIWVWAPDYSLVICIDDNEEWATNIDATNKDVVLQFDLPRPFEFSKYSCSPNVHLAIICDCSRGMPCRDLFEVVWSGIFRAFRIIWMARVNPDWLELILIWIIADLAKVICSTGPQLTTSIFTALG